ncbi:MAG: hypothetical protein JSS14_22245 [Proteobacteria bacterium]|nr:hypothetical protein [Pseudomonadota bacterium]
MSTGPENTFIKSVHGHLPAAVYHMKNHNEYIAGPADVWYSGAAGDVWIEYKFINVPARPDTVIDLITPKGKGDAIITTLQQDWLRARDREGRRVGVIVGSKDGGIWLPGVDWSCRFTAAEFLKRLKSRKQLADTIRNIVLTPGM